MPIKGFTDLLEEENMPLFEGGRVRADFAGEVVSVLRSKRELLYSIVDSEPDLRVSFAEATAVLAGQLDLEAAREEAVRAHERWGLVGQNDDRYGSLFDTVTVNGAELLQVRERLERGEKMLPIFDAGEMTPDALFKVLFTDGGVPYLEHMRYPVRNLPTLRRIDPKDVEGLYYLDGLPRYFQQSAFKEVYEQAQPLQPTGPRLLFTPDELKQSSPAVSMVRDLQRQSFGKGGPRFIDPNADFIRFRTQMDAGLEKIANKWGGSLDTLSSEEYWSFLDTNFERNGLNPYMPDRDRRSRHPNYIFKNGASSGIGFIAPYGKVFFDQLHPADKIQCSSRTTLG